MIVCGTRMERENRWQCNSTRCPFYHVPERGSFIVHTACIRRDIPWQLPCFRDNKLAPWNGVLLEKLLTPQLIKNFLAFYGTRTLISLFTRAYHFSLYWVRSIQFIPYPTFWRSNLLSSHLRVGLISGLFPWDFPTKTLFATVLFPCVLHIQPISLFLIWSTEWYLVSSTDHKAPRYVVLFTPLLPPLS
jgi:hypothetical protein